MERQEDDVLRLGIWRQQAQVEIERIGLQKYRTGLLRIDIAEAGQAADWSRSGRLKGELLRAQMTKRTSAGQLVGLTALAPAPQWEPITDV